MARPSSGSVKVHQEFALDRELRIEMELVTCHELVPGVMNAYLLLLSLTILARERERE